MLYWDNVATIVPRAYIQTPELHHPFTLELIRAGLLYQVFPEDAGGSLGEHFENYLHRLSSAEIERRRRNFIAGSTTLVHRDKWLTYMGGLAEIEHLGLAASDNYVEPGNWISI